MEKETRLEIAGVGVSLTVPEAYASFTMPRSWEPFLATSSKSPFPVRAALSPLPFTLKEGMKEVSASFNDLGAARLLSDGTDYAVAISAGPGCAESYLEFGRDFRSGTFHIPAEDPHLTFLTDSMMRILMSQAFVTMGAFMLHSSAIVADGEGAYLFMGESGTGKSTHTRMWRETFTDVHLLNDDIPVVRLMPDGRPMVFGSPWSGKTPCWRDESAPLRAMTRLEQAPENEYRRLADIEALVAVLPGVSVITVCRRLYDAACETVLAILPQVEVGRMRCLPNHDAARVAREELGVRS